MPAFRSLERFAKRSLVFTLVAAFPSAAADDAKQQKIAELVRVTRLQDNFERQIAQMRSSYLDFGKKIFSQIISESDADAEKKARLDAIFQRYVERGLSLWKAEDLVALWASYFGKDLSIEDLDQIIAFYKSPIGQKEVAANEAAIGPFTAEMRARGQSSIREAIEQLAAELKEEASK
jgi:hypothetical protein